MCLFFFFSSRRRHTRCSRDWSSDVCSSDLYLKEFPEAAPVAATALGDHRFDSRLDEVSVAAWQSRVVFAELYLSALEPIDKARLSRANQVDALLLKHRLEYERWRLQTLEAWRWDPLIYTGIAGDAVNRSEERR